MEIEIGDYVRFEKGEIRKITGIDEDGHFLVNYNYRNGKWLTNFDVTEITKHSKNLIDIIEVNDFVNGKKIDMITTIPIKKELTTLLFYNTDLPLGSEFYFMVNSEIKTVLTHEQYERNSFNVGE